MIASRLLSHRLAAALLLAGALGACVGPAREPVTSLSGLGGDETVVVGRIELVPPLRKGEQKFKGIIIGDFENKIILMADEQYRVLTKEPTVADYTGRIEAKLGQTFFVRSRNRPFYILGGMMYLTLTSGGAVEDVYFPGGMKVAIKPEDRAVYIGTLQYHCDEFFDIKKVSLVDDYAAASAEFKKKFGAKYPLRKALLTAVK